MGSSKYSKRKITWRVVNPSKLFGGKSEEDFTKQSLEKFRG